jgi:hypothetical protein
MTAGEIVAIVAGAVTVIGAIVSLVRYLRGTYARDEAPPSGGPRTGSML